MHFAIRIRAPHVEPVACFALTHSRQWRTETFRAISNVFSFRDRVLMIGVRYVRNR